MRHRMYWMGIAAVLLLAQSAARAAETAAPAPSDASVKALMQKDVAGIADKEVLMLSVEYAPGGASLPHRHDAQVFVYVLEGELTMQVEGAAAVTLRRGDTFYENPNDVHLVSANASKSAPAKILVFMIKTKGAPATRAAAARGAT